MFIKNKKSGVITEVSNEDVINHCKKNSDEYEVADKLSGFGKEPEPEEIEEVEDTEEPREESTENEETPVVEDYSLLSVADLRKVAKEKGIQGYANMNKETLVEVIKAHE